MTDKFLTAVRPTAVVDAVDQKLTIDQGTTATIRCEVTGTPQPTVTWSKSRGDLTERHRVRFPIMAPQQLKIYNFLLFCVNNTTLN